MWKARGEIVMAPISPPYMASHTAAKMANEAACCWLAVGPLLLTAPPAAPAPPCLPGGGEPGGLLPAAAAQPEVFLPALLGMLVLVGGGLVEGSSRD